MSLQISSVDITHETTKLESKKPSKEKKSYKTDLEIRKLNSEIKSLKLDYFAAFAVVMFCITVGFFLSVLASSVALSAVREVNGTVMEVKELIEKLEATNQKLIERLKTRSSEENILTASVGSSKLVDSTEELRSEKTKTKNSEEDILTAIVGSWRMVSSTGMEKYVKKTLDKIKTEKEWSFVFQAGVQHFEFDAASQQISTYETIGNKKFEELNSVLGEIATNPSNRYSTFTTFVERHGTQLSTVFVNYSENEYLRRERYIRDGKLYVVHKRFGMSCTRIYEKVETSKDAFL